MKNINIGGGGRQGSGNSSGLSKIKSEYIPSMLKNSNTNGYGVE
jgi:hypothetical protein